MKIPFKDIRSLIQMASFAESYDPDFDETDHLLLQRMGQWLKSSRKEARVAKDIETATRAFLHWFEDCFGEEGWLDYEDTTDGPDGTWKSYLDHPIYLELRRLLP